MKIAVVADEKRKDKDEPILKEAKKVFDECLYVPITQVRFDIEREMAVKIDHTNLMDFDCVLPIPTDTYKEMFYILLRTLSTSVCLPFGDERFFLVTENVLLTKYLMDNGIAVREFSIIASKESLKGIVKKLNFPLIARPSFKKIIVNDVNNLTGVVSMTKIGTPIEIEAPVKSKNNVWTFVVGDRVAGYYSTEGKLEIDEKLIDLSLKIRELLNCDYCALNFVRSKRRWFFNRLTFSPDFARFQKMSHKNISKVLIHHLYEKVKKSKEKTWWQRVCDELLRR